MEEEDQDQVNLKKKFENPNLQKDSIFNSGEFCRQQWKKGRKEGEQETELRPQGQEFLPAKAEEEGVGEEEEEQCDGNEVLCSASRDCEKAWLGCRGCALHTSRGEAAGR